MTKNKPKYKRYPNLKNFPQRKNKKKFAKIVAETGDPYRAQTEAYPGRRWPSGIESEAERHMGDPEVVGHILRIWKSKGLTLDVASQRHMDILMGKGKRIKPSDVLRAVEMVYKGNKIPGFTQDSDPNTGKSILQIFIDQRKERGLSLPEGIIDAKEVKGKEGLEQGKEVGENA